MALQPRGTARPVLAQRRNRRHCKRLAYLLSPLCPGYLRTRTHATSTLYRNGIPCCEVPHNAVARGAARVVLDASRTVAGDFAECAACHPEE